MKKLALTALFGFISTATFAAPVGSTFTDLGVGIDISSTKYKVDGENFKHKAGFGIIVDYGFDYGSNFVGLVEGKIKLNNSTLLDITDSDGYSKASEKWRANVSYLQGYRVLPDLLPYVKVGYTVAKLKEEYRESAPNSSNYGSVSETANGFGAGLGVKYAISSNFEIGAEYLRSRIKFDGEKLNLDTFSANATYRF